MKKSAEIYAFRNKSGEFLKNLHLFCVPKLLRRLEVVRGSDFLEKSIRFAGFLAVIFTSQSKNLQQLMHSEKILSFLGDFVFLSFHFANWNSFQKAMLFWKNPSDLLVVWL